MKEPDKRMDPWKEALLCYEEISEEVVVVGGDLQEEFKWSELGKMIQEGYDKCTGDWVIHLSVDMFIHESNIKEILNSLKNLYDVPAISLPKYKFFEPRRYEVKNFETVIFNKKHFKNIVFNGGGDLALPTLDKKVLNQSNTKILKYPIWNYDTTFRTREVISKDRARFARAWNREFGNFGDRGGPTDKEAFNAWYNMVKTRYPLHTSTVAISKHPKFIQQKLYDLTPKQFGYDLFGLRNNVSFNFLNKLKQKKIKYKYNLDSL